MREEFELSYIKQTMEKLCMTVASTFLTRTILTIHIKKGYPNDPYPE